MTSIQDVNKRETEPHTLLIEITNAQSVYVFNDFTKAYFRVAKTEAVFTIKNQCHKDTQIQYLVWEGSVWIL